MHLSLLWMSSFLLLIDGGLKSLLFFISKVEWGASTNVLSFWWSIMHESESLCSVCIISKILKENVTQLRSGLTLPTVFHSDSKYLLQEAVTCWRLSLRHEALMMGDWFVLNDALGLSWWFSSKGSTCQCRRGGFDPWVGKIPWRRK